MAPDSKSSSSSDTDDSDELRTDKSKELISKNSISSHIKKRRSKIAICLPNNRYEVLKKIVSKFGYREVQEGENWNFYWTDLSITVERCKEMKRYQKINHFPGMLEICRKDLLARNLNRMLRLFPKDYNFFPRTWVLPADLGEALNYSKMKKNKTFILKPDAGSQGRGICVTKSLKEVRPCDRGVCQVYLTRPFLIDGYKFDLRVYALITSCDPLRIYVYDEGMIRFATSKYKEPNSINISNVFMHLTNYAVNKYSRTYNQDKDEGSRRKLTWFNEYMRKMGYDIDNLWKRMDDLIIKTVLSACPVLKHSYMACFPNHDVIPACCELLGVDIILDHHLNPLLLEVNHSPSFHTDTQLDWEIKESLLTDMFNMINLEYCDKKGIMREDRQRVRDRLLHGKDSMHKINAHNEFADYFKRELFNSGKFRIIYPCKNMREAYKRYFEQGQASIFNETLASRAREAAQCALRDEMLLRAQIEAAKNMAPKVLPLLPPRSKSELNTNFNLLQPVVINSSVPQMIIEAEEKDRLQKLAQREYLLRSHGILEHIYFSMKKNGNLRPRDEKKFAIFEKLRNNENRNEYKNRHNQINISDFMRACNN